MLSAAAGRAVVFDLDGVIVDSRRAVRGAVNAALVENGVAARPPRSVDRFIGPPVRWAFASLTGAAEDSALVSACVDAYHRRLRGVVPGGDGARSPGSTRCSSGLDLPLALATAKVDRLRRAAARSHRARRALRGRRGAVDAGAGRAEDGDRGAGARRARGRGRGCGHGRRSVVRRRGGARERDPLGRGAVGNRRPGRARARGRRT